MALTVIADGNRDAAGLRVALPGGSGAKVAPIAFETCSKSSAQTLSVSAVEPIDQAL